MDETVSGPPRRGNAVIVLWQGDERVGIVTRVYADDAMPNVNVCLLEDDCGDFGAVMDIPHKSRVSEADRTYWFWEQP